MRLFVLPLIAIIALLPVDALLAKARLDIPGYVEGIHSAMLKGSSKDLSVHFHQDLHLRLGELSGKFSKSQAEYLLRDFFTNYPPREFEVVHNGESSDKTRFVLGYFNAGGETFSLLIKGKRDEDGVVKICELELSIP